MQPGLSLYDGEGGWGGVHTQEGIAMQGAHITSSDFTAPTASGPSSVTHFLEPSMRGPTGMPRLARMNLRILKWLSGGLGTAPAPASAAGARTATGSAAGLTTEFINKATPANANRELKAFLRILKTQLLQGGLPGETSQAPTYFLIDGCPA